MATPRSAMNTAITVADMPSERDASEKDSAESSHVTGAMPA